MALTFTESYIVRYVLSQVIEAVSWDNIDQQYRDNGNILVSFSKSELKSLKAAYEKIGNGSLRETPKKMTGANRPPLTKERLISLFTFEAKNNQYYLRYQTLGHARQDWKSDRPVLDAMIKEGTVKVVDKTRNTILYKYTPQPPTYETPLP